MSYVNTFIILSKDKDRTNKIYNFLSSIKVESKHDRHNDICLDILDKSIYGEWYAVKGDLRNTYGSNIKHWMLKTNNESLLDDCYFIISYESESCIQLEDIMNDQRETLMNIFGDLTIDGEKLVGILPLDDIWEYFWDRL